MKLVVAVFTGMLLLMPTARASAEPVDCEADRCLIQATIDAECSCALARNHGSYTTCVARVVNAAAHDGTISRRCRGKINGCFIRSTCGKKEGSVNCQFPGKNGRCRPLASADKCSKRGGTIVESCCTTCGGTVPTATPTEAATATPVGATETPAETPTPAGATAVTTTPTPEETPTETATAGGGETATPVETGTPVGGETATPAEATATPVGGETATPAGATATPVETATTAGATATPGEATATPVETATPAGGETATPTEGGVATPSASATPAETATGGGESPTPVPTSTPGSGDLCGNNTVDAGEFCDPPGSQCPNAGPGFTCSLSCTCDCPTVITFTGDATDPASILDTGWTGIAHRAPIITNGAVTVSVSCSDGRPCGTCPISGPIPNTQPGQLQDQRCTNDTSIQCTDNTPCTAGGGTCQFFFGSNLPLAAGGVTTCVVNQFNGALTGTANIETGESATAVLLTSRVFNGIAIDNPCPRCVGDTTENDGVQGGKCDGGPRINLNCDANGSVPNRPDFGQTSLDCPPSAAALIATLPIDLSSATDPVTKTLSAASPGCSGEPGERCLCDTCNNLAATPCDDNSDCPTSGGAAGICGGRRCIGGTNAGAPCSTASACPSGGICGRPGEPTKPSACLDDTSTVGVLDCTDTAPVDGEGECTGGPITQHCSVASGHAQRGCTDDAGCGGASGSCESENRQCFLTGGFSGKNGTNTLIAEGKEDPPVNDVSHPTLGAVFCVGPTGLSSVNNVAGLPGPGRVTIRGTAVGLP